VWDKYVWTILSGLLLNFGISDKHSTQPQFRKREPCLKKNITLFLFFTHVFCDNDLIYYYPSTLSTSSGISIGYVAYAGDLYIQKNEYLCSLTLWIILLNNSSLHTEISDHIPPIFWLFGLKVQ